VASKTQPAGGSLGTFAGVFTPSILTILGIILFLRLGYVTGAAGISGALLIILIANAISLLTSISLSAIATNLRVKGGGDYYLISRTLGVEYGGALGLVLFLAQSISIAFYAIGFGEVVATLSGAKADWAPQVVAAVAVAALFVLAWLGADWATRFQYVVMAVLFVAIVGFFLGGLPNWDPAIFRANLRPGILYDSFGGTGSTVPFWTAFALFFPAVTGFTQGVSMSGDLRNAGRSLPVGTFAAVGISFVVYIGVAVVFAGVLPSSELLSDYGSMRKVAITPRLVDAGVIAATLSSALASFLGAPRILQSLATDRVFPLLSFFAAGQGSASNPRRGVVLSALIAFGTIGLGDLNAIAPVVSMFFLLSYGLLNYATYLEAQANSPSFRPRFRFFHARLSLVGGLGCLGMMLAINPTAAVVSVVVLFGIYYYIASTVSVTRWADSGRSRHFQRIRDDLHAISTKSEHARYWRPVLLAFSNNPERRGRLLRFASWLEGGSGLTTAVRVIEGEGPRTRQMRKDAESELRTEIEEHSLPAFPRVIVAPDGEDALPVLLQAYGLGPVQANTVLMNWNALRPSENGPEPRSYGRYLRLALRFSCNLVLLEAGAQNFAALDHVKREDRRIDVWHRDNATGRLMLLLAYLMTRTPEWEDAQIRLFSVAPKDGNRREVLDHLERMLDDVRIAAEPLLVDEADARTVIRYSAGSGVVFLPFRLSDEGPTGVFGDGLDELVRELGITALVLAAQDIVLDTEPESGPPGEVAQAVDAVERARKRAQKVEKGAAQAAETVRKSREELEAARSSGATGDELAELESAAQSAEEEAERSRRRTATAKAKADAAAEEAEALTGKPPDEKKDDSGDD